MHDSQTERACCCVCWSLGRTMCPVTAVATLAATPSVPVARLPSAAVILENKDGRFTEKQRAAACDELNRREYAAFGYLAGDASYSGIAKFAQAYVDYYDRLSTEEQQSTVYKGSGDDARRLLAQAKAAAAAQAAGGDPRSKEVRTALQVFLDAFEQRLPKPLREASSSAASTGRDHATISDHARRLNVDPAAVAPSSVNAVARRYGA